MRRILLRPLFGALLVGACARPEPAPPAQPAWVPYNAYPGSYGFCPPGHVPVHAGCQRVAVAALPTSAAVPPAVPSAAASSTASTSGAPWAQPASPPAAHGQGYAPVAAAHQQGIASYYHDSLAGNATASGEKYDPALLTAAHRTLAFGTVIDVVRPDGRWVRVRVNDRGPFKKGRVVDLSRAAAEKIGLIEEGITEVNLYLR